MSVSDPIPDPAPVPGSPATAPVKPRKRRRWLRRVVIGLVSLCLIVILLVLAAPTLLSTGPARSMILDSVNKRLNGKVAVTDWSLGWFTGVHVTGLKVTDATGRQMASVDTVSIPMPLWHAVTGRYPIGDSKVDGVTFDAVVGSDGDLNFSKLAKPSATPTKSEPAKPASSKGFALPDVFGKLTVSNVHGTYARPGKPVLALTSLNAAVDLPRGDGQLTANARADVQNGTGPVTAVALDAKVAIRRGETVQLGAGDLSATARAAGDAGDSVTLSVALTPVGPSAPSTLKYQEKLVASGPRLNKEFGLTPADLQLVSGNVTLTADGTFDSSTMSFSTEPADLKVADLTVDHLDAGKPTPVLEHLAINGNLQMSATFGTAVAIKIAMCDISDSQNLFSLKTSKLEFTSEAGKFSGPGGAVIAMADLPKLSALFRNLQTAAAAPTTAPAAPAPQTIETGIASLTLTVTPQPALLHAVVAGTIHNLVLAGPEGKTPADEVAITADASVTPDFGTLTVKQAGVHSRFAAVSVDDATIALNAKSVLDMVQKATVRFDVPDLKTTAALAQSFSKPVAAAAGAPVVPPLVIDSGSESAAIVLARSGALLDVSLDESTKDVVFHRGTVSRTVDPTSVKCRVRLTTAAADSLMASIAKLEIPELAASVGQDGITVTKPIVVTGLASQLAAEGSFKASVLLDRVLPLLAALTGKPADAYPYTGPFTADESVTTSAGKIALAGSMDVTNFVMLKDGKPQFSEPHIAVRNDLSVTPVGTDYDLAIKNLSVAFESSKAFGVTIADGSVGHLMTTRDLNLKPAITYDLAKLWPAIQPMAGDSLKTLKIAGVATRTWAVTGSYPADKPFGEAIKTVVASGSTPVDNFEYDGIKTDGAFEAKFRLSDGHLMTGGADPANPEAPCSIAANGGQIRFDHFNIDLTREALRLSIPADYPLISHFTINPIFADTVLAKFLNNPLFAGTKDATGLLDLTIKSCVNLPLGALLDSTAPENDGTAAGTLSLTQLHLGIASDAFKDLLKEGSFEADVKDATFAFARGKMTEHFSFQTGAYALPLDGTVLLATKALDMTLGVPINWIVRTHLVKDPNIVKQVPEQITVPLRGTLTSPQINAQAMFATVMKDAAVKAEQQRLLNGVGGKNAKQINDLLNGLGGKKKQ
jgi:hypothetical protein